MWSAEAVLVCALELLGRSVRSFPPIELVATPPPEATPGVEGYVRFDTRTIYIVTTSGTFQVLQRGREKCADLNATRKLASILVHEEVHLKKGPDERGAYEAQLVTLTLLGAGLGTPPYQEVTRAMRVAMDRQKHRPPQQMASASVH
jgi:hypothetical protein